MELDSQKKIRVELVLFFVFFATYSYFYQGGGWNQNSRFAQIRSIVESRRLDVNNTIIYESSIAYGQPVLRRVEVAPDLSADAIAGTAGTGDIAIFDGYVYPNKPPGAVVAALPAYAILYGIGRWFGRDPDHWWNLTLDAYLTTVFSVSLLTALGGVVFYRISLRLFPSAPAWAHAASTLSFGLATLILPFATMLFDHNLVASLSLFSFLLLLKEKDSAVRLTVIALGASGFLSGFMLLVSYGSAISVLGLAWYAARVSRSWRRYPVYLGGFALPVFFLAWYHQVCFGSVLAHANTYEYGLFHGEEMRLAGMFGLPQLGNMMELLFYSYRGLFFTSPVLLFSFLGLGSMLRVKRLRGEATLFLLVFIAYLLMNSAMKYWHAGWSIGPRYLIPALPFLCLPLTVVFARWPRFTLAVAMFSALIMLLATAVDPQPPAGFTRPWTQYVLPLALGQTVTLKDVQFQGPVSANPVGAFESWLRLVQGRNAVERDWHSFNLGEFFWPRSLKSLFPLVSFLALGLGLVWYWSVPRNRGW